MSSLTTFRDHCRKMAEAEHKPDTCPMLTAVEPYWPPGGWAPIDEDGNWTGGLVGSALGWMGPKPPWSPPHCDGCNPESDRALFRRMASEVDEYLAPQPDLFGDLTTEPAEEAQQIGEAS